MTYKIVIFLLVLNVLFIGGCQVTEKVKAPEDEIPAWAVQPPRDNPTYYYGIGEAHTLDDSKLAALNEISSKLGVRIGGESEQIISVTNNRVVNYGSNRVTAETVKKKITNFEVIQSYKSGRSVYSLVRVEKSQLLGDMKTELKQYTDSFNQKINTLTRLSVIEQYMVLNELISSIPMAEALLPMIKNLDPTFLNMPYQKQYQSIRQQREEHRLELNLFVTAPSHLSPFVSVITSQLVAVGIKASGRKGSTYNTSLSINGGERTSTPFGNAKSVEMSLTIRITDENGTLISSRPFKIIGNSVVDFKSARVAAANNFSLQVNEKGVFKMIGLQL